MIEFTHIVDGKVMVGAKKPESLNRLPEGHEENELITIHEKYDMDEHEAGLRPVVNADKLVRCSKCGTLGIVLEGELPIMCQLPMAIRTSGICGGYYSIYHGEKWNGQKVKTKLTPEGKVITNLI